MDFHLLRAGPCEVARERQKVRAPVRRQAPLILFFSQARAGRGLFLSRLPLAADRRDDFTRLLHRRKGLVDRLAVKTRKFGDLAGIERFARLAHGFENDVLVFHFCLPLTS